MLSSITLPAYRSGASLAKRPQFSGRLEDFARDVRSWQSMQHRDSVLADRELKLEAAKRIWSADASHQAKIVGALEQEVFTALIPGARPKRMSFRLFDFLEHYYDQERTAYRETYVFEGFAKGKITLPSLTWRQLMEPLLGEKGVGKAAGHINKTLAQFKLIEPAGLWWWSPRQITPLGRAAYEMTQERLIIKSH